MRGTAALNKSEQGVYENVLVHTLLFTVDEEITKRFVQR